ncbi:sugar diacid recognition domain-containing protein [Vibrio sinaloensis]|uniref:sugar diacid recognition domain-containing protein n=1 Tax=Photobacterium sp. (strain ATCC 43367) TaxID=379097 RepID=UPI0035EB17C6
MQINTLIAQQIVARATKIIQFPVNVMDDLGQIIGSSDAARLHHTHEGALLAINDNRKVEIDQAMASTLSGVKEGINLPIVYQDEVIGVVGISGSPDEVRRYGELVKMTAELIVEHEAMLAQIQWDKRHREELLLQLIQGSSLSEAQLLSVAQNLKLDLAQPRVAVAVKVIPKVGQILSLEQQQRLTQLFESATQDNIVGMISLASNDWVLLKPVRLKEGVWQHQHDRIELEKLLHNVEQQSGVSATIAVGEYFPGVEGLARSYDTAKATLDFTANKTSRVLFYHRHKLAVLVAGLQQDEWRRAQLVAPLEKLQQESKSVLFNTLQVYLMHDCDLSLTCEALSIHRNTLRYRLEKIEQLTELKLNQMEHRVLLYLGYKCW